MNGFQTNFSMGSSGEEFLLIFIYDFRLEYVWFSFGRDVFSEKVTRFFVLGGLYFVVPIQLFDTVSILLDR